MTATRFVAACLLIAFLVLLGLFFGEDGTTKPVEVPSEPAAESAPIDATPSI